MILILCGEVAESFLFKVVCVCYTACKSARWVNQNKNKSKSNLETRNKRRRKGQALSVFSTSSIFLFLFLFFVFFVSVTLTTIRKKQILGNTDRGTENIQRDGRNKKKKKDDASGLWVFEQRT